MGIADWKVGQKVKVYAHTAKRGKQLESVDGEVIQIQKNGVLIVRYSRIGETQLITRKFSGVHSAYDRASETGEGVKKRMILKVDPLTEEGDAAEAAEVTRLQALEMRQRVIHLLKNDTYSWDLEAITNIMNTLEGTKQ